MLYRYSRWDGSQEVDPFTPDDLMDAIADDLMEDGNLRDALQRLFRWGTNGPDGERMQGLQDILDRLRERRQEELQRYDLGSMMDDIQKQLEDVIRTERQGIQRRLDQMNRPDDQGHPPDPALQKALEKIANQKQQALDQMPREPAGQIKALSDYDFMDQEARQKFDDLMKMLQQQMLGNQFEGLKQSIQSLTPQDMQAMREMIRDLNNMLREQMRGGNPDFQGFMNKHGQFFPPGINSLDELVEHLQRRNAQMQSMLNSMSPEMRQSLQQMMNDLLRDDRLRWDMLQLAANLEQILPMRQFQNRYPFSGDESLTMEEAMRLMERLQQMDEIERELRGARNADDLQNVDVEKIGDLAGPEAAKQLEQLRQITKLLEESGYLEKKGQSYELTAKAIRRIGQKALRDIFGKLKKDAFGKHETEFRGTGGERSDESKLYEFGDPFLVNLEETLMNSLVREGAGTPVRIQPEDFEVYRTEHMTESSIVLMVDMSRSMILRGCFSAAKKVVLALNSLIKGQYPKDNLYIVLFSEYAREVKAEVLPELSWDHETYGTNLHHALMLSRRLLGKHKMGNKQVIVITDGEPTAHLEGDIARFSYPPTPRTVLETLKEVDRCTKDRIVINTFMLEQSRSLVEFVNQMTKINKGRAFFCTPERLGEYILVDYVSSKRKKVA
jgi:uncharacterized protein with von Willebrand factor type A (vWA) domain